MQPKNLIISTVKYTVLPLLQSVIAWLSATPHGQRLNIFPNGDDTDEYMFDYTHIIIYLYMGNLVRIFLIVH